MVVKRFIAVTAAWIISLTLACMIFPMSAFAHVMNAQASLVSYSPTIYKQSVDVASDDQTHLDIQSSGKPTLIIPCAMNPVTLKLGSTYSLSAISSQNARISYYSPTPKRVSVTRAGLLKAHSVGVAYIVVSAESNGLKTTRQVKIRVVSSDKYIPGKSIESKVSKKAMWVGQKTRISTKFIPRAASNKNLVYKSITPKTASVSVRGIITGKTPGTAKVLVSSAANPKVKAIVTMKIKAKPKRVLKDYSWSQLKAISKRVAAAKNDEEGLSIAKKYGLLDANGKLKGDRKSLALANGMKTAVRILGFRQDKLVSGKLSGISFEFVNVPEKHCMNATYTNAGGWSLSEMRSWLNTSFYHQLPNSLRKHIVAVYKKTNNVGEVDDLNISGSVSSTKDKLWLLSSTEVYGKFPNKEITSSYGSFFERYYPIYNAEGSQYKLYMDNSESRIKKSDSWWLRSSDPHDPGRFNYVGDYYGWSNSSARDKLLVSPGFCF